MEITTKKCPFCFEEIQYDAVKCKHCGEFLDMRFAPQPFIEKKWNPGTAAILSFFIPGAGQVYKGQIATGIAILLFILCI